MIPELGHFALALALALALAQGTLPIVGAARGNALWMGLARPAAQAQFLCLALAFAALAYSFVASDFSVLNVANNSNSRLPAVYRFAATWGSHEGSLMLWMLMYGAWMLAVSAFSRNLPDAMAARVLGVMGLVGAGFLLFILTTSNPFERLDPAAAEGRDLNPLLQDPGMAIHPPLLYMGYVGFAVAFSFAIAALIGGKLDAAWARWSRPWTTAAWCFLTAGIALGSWWAYYELGWGGWWFWDPVENASFMPWLAGTALIHSLAVTEKRGGFRNWTVLLAILTFSLSLLGTFLVRSGVLTSVHAFATDPARGVFILSFLVLVIGGSLALFAWRAGRVGLGGAFELVSRESFLLANNVLLLVAAGSVLLGTLYPLFLDALGLGKISVGPPYFETVFVPLMAPAVFLMGIGPLARWKEAKLPDLAVRLRWAAAVSLVSALLVPALAGDWSLAVAFGLALGFWILAASAAGLYERAGGFGAGLAARLHAQPRGYYGMLIAHCGVAVLIIGVTLVRGFEVERDLRMAVNDSVTVGAYTFRFAGVEKARGPNYVAERGTFEVAREGARTRTLQPEKRTYLAQPSNPMTEAAIATGLAGDVYVTLGEPLEGGAWLVRIYLKPFVTWIWGGAFLMMLGGFLALSDRRYRLAARRSRTAPGGVAVAP
ncbi:MAG: c-type cytochrome biogenesis protein CcmF [Betaproteobacteria bacterium RIFCSPHIGHO2_12_FULL_69_13]|nr:MAG: c-type cytochrome biogenesis protein CcmF [Betaproteobacteria bacterium RIFCSPHIGHO2_12_FULL_69_13]OGA65861.1 MAG: c-type cytochrome biogenesis protein CcmF [Betaproteobacteria bacterium RIFCSPLOWO2_12_FULL_68_20]